MMRTELTRQGRGVTQFLGEVRSELRKVVWPTRREAANLTVLVIALSMAMGVLLGGVDFLFQQLFRVIVGA
jgi:preprotein translocase subunit SecE